MSAMSKMKIGDTVSFDVYPASIIGTKFKQCKVLAFLDAESAVNWIDPAAMHINVYPTLPTGTPNRYNAYSYIKVRLANGVTTCVGDPWIKADTVKVVTSNRLQVILEDVNPEDAQKVANILLQNGYANISVDLIE